MTKIKKLIKEYQHHTFSTGTTKGSDYKIFEQKYRNVLKDVAANIGGKLTSFNKNHYCLSAVIEKNGKYVYMSISDVRFSPNQWFNHILVRTATHAKDYAGGPNQYTTLEELEEKLNRMLS